MDVTLLGTGAPAGLPRPDCPCAVCADSTGARARAATALLVDGTLLIDLTPGPALAAARAGQSLHGVRQVLLSHPQDGPALEVPPGLPAPVRVPDGQELVLISGHRVEAVALDTPGTGYAVTGPDGQRLLYLPPGASPAGARDTETPYDTVLLDVLGRPEALAKLRGTQAVGATTDVLAVHIDHTQPPGAELHRRLAAAGARAVADGTSLSAGDFRDVPDVPRRTLVLGGARSGKSAEAERRLAAFPEVLYVATGGSRDGDHEWAARIGAHRERRPATWRTAETCDLVPLLAEPAGPPLLIDCLALWLTHTMDAVDAWSDEAWVRGAERELGERVGELVAAVRATGRTVVAVSNEVGAGIVPATAAGRRFRDALGQLNAAVAAECEHVLLVVAGHALPLRGAREPFQG
ncbi:bifunctional adenosylcobinamide kinase/adenosylcobinamide-phosphate guanylyltransferase [Streptomyces sp. JJ66]|uniref:bifunctional adenosylcobinamide kinase/adenosylcobinamide-phosphate guanylyltransferase n=1 Tax=Streptomyces sp. JJ66 TaxID=2803843 RepID=UPI001C56DF5C|nr:bifunctional adenosylcobinamide kinase/adenosylcobinamide-phosphate guanylyltransferase [Streptomyces sp. JJ66]MBW1601617.1 bifunctional adenosylcobinamide kinase/adenosylcobinamide-phosphate guanylyltransferase [Streptomyces sp. JJ66]